MKYVDTYKRTLALVAPGLFPGLCDARGQHLLRVFASRAEEWDADLRELAHRDLDEGEFVVMREVRAHLFQRPRAPPRGAGFLSQVFHCDEDEADSRFSEALMRESERVLRAAFPQSEVLLDAELDLLRRRFPDAQQFELGCHLIGVVLSGRQTNGSQVARELGIPRRTVARHIAAVWALVQERFPRLGAMPRSGRPKKVADVPTDSDDLDSDDDIL
jgi:hypothetical protein